RLITEAYAAWDELWDDLGQSHLDPRGFLCVSREEGDEAEQYLEGMREGGYGFDHVEAAEAVRRWPFLEAGAFRYAFFSQEGGALHCRRIAGGMAAWLREQGANVYENSKAVAIDRDAGRVELESGETLSADRI